MSDIKKQKKPQGNFNIVLNESNAKFINDRVEKSVTKVAAINDCIEFARLNEKDFKEFLLEKFTRTLEPTA